MADDTPFGAGVLEERMDLYDTKGQTPAVRAFQEVVEFAANFVVIDDVAKLPLKVSDIYRKMNDLVQQKNVACVELAKRGIARPQAAVSLCRSKQQNQAGARPGSPVRWLTQKESWGEPQPTEPFSFRS